MTLDIKLYYVITGWGFLLCRRINLIQITKYYEVLICNLVWNDNQHNSKRLEIMIKKQSLFFQILLFGKLFCLVIRTGFNLKTSS